MRYLLYLIDQWQEHPQENFQFFKYFYLNLKNFLPLDFEALACQSKPGCCRSKFLNQIGICRFDPVLAYSKLFFDLYLNYYYHYLIQNGFIMTKHLGSPAIHYFDILNLGPLLKFKHQMIQFHQLTFTQGCQILRCDSYHDQLRQKH